MSLRKCAVIVQRLSNESTVNNVQQICEKIGEIEDFVLQLDEDVNFHGCAFVVYKEEDDALTATMSLSKDNLKVQYMLDDQVKELKELLRDDMQSKHFWIHMASLLQLERNRLLSICMRIVTRHQRVVKQS